MYLGYHTIIMLPPFLLVTCKIMLLYVITIFALPCQVFAASFFIKQTAMVSVSQGVIATKGRAKQVISFHHVFSGIK